MDRLQQFCRLFAVPECALPVLGHFVSDRDVDVVLALGHSTLTVRDAARRLNLGEPETAVLLEELYRVYILNKTDAGNLEGLTYSISDFYARLDYQCKFDPNYLQLPKDVRDALDTWCYEVYKERTLPYIQQLREHEEMQQTPETYELVDNLEEFIDRSHAIRMVPCNCRMLAQNCARPTGTCLGFDSALSDRTGGTPLTKEEAKEIVRMAHKKGLMHQVNSDWRSKGPQWMCNCCGCCCYPLRLSQELGTKGVFPLVQYVARRNEEICTHCGACTKRCHFAAFHYEGGEVVVEGKVRRRVVLDADKCYGCGICQSTCPADAITMVKI